MGVLLALAHEFDMPGLTLRIKRMLLLPAGHAYAEDRKLVKLPTHSCLHLKRVRGTGHPRKMASHSSPCHHSARVNSSSYSHKDA